MQWCNETSQDQKGHVFKILNLLKTAWCTVLSLADTVASQTPEKNLRIFQDKQCYSMLISSTAPNSLCRWEMPQLVAHRGELVLPILWWVEMCLHFSIKQYGFKAWFHLLQTVRPGAKWWVIFIVSLTRFGVTQKIHLWVCLWGGSIEI